MVLAPRVIYYTRIANFALKGVRSQLRRGPRISEGRVQRGRALSGVATLELLTNWGWTVSSALFVKFSSAGELMNTKFSRSNNAMHHSDFSID